MPSTWRRALPRCSATSPTAPCPSTTLPSRTPTTRSLWEEKNWLFVGSERAGRRATTIQSLLATAKLNGLVPHARLEDTQEKLPTWPYSRIDELLYLVPSPAPEPHCQRGTVERLPASGAAGIGRGLETLFTHTDTFIIFHPHPPCGTLGCCVQWGYRWPRGEDRGDGRIRVGSRAGLAGSRSGYATARAVPGLWPPGTRPSR